MKNIIKRCWFVVFTLIMFMATLIAASLAHRFGNDYIAKMICVVMKALYCIVILIVVLTT